MTKTFEHRASQSRNLTLKKLFGIIVDKKSNLILSIDVQDANKVLRMAELLGDYICCLKTHVDVITNFNMDFISKLLKIAKDKNFLIFEDRKFADIGNTVKLQYSSGMYNIADWADITNAHPIPGDGIVSGLKQGIKRNEPSWIAKG
jgi:orotidine 5'-phosphate decarboxylase subfamily 1